MQHYIDVLNKLTILYIEDENPIREGMSQLLSFVFKRVIQAVDGSDGLDKFKQNKDSIDIILSDINMPNLNGVEMMKKIREIDTNIPTVFLADEEDNKYLIELINMQIAQYIIKPISGDDLLDKIYVAYLPTLHNKQIEEKNIQLEKLNAQIIKESEEKIKRITKEQLKTQSMNDLFNAYTISLEFNLEGKITFVSDLFLKVSDFKREELIGEFYGVVRVEYSKDELEEIKKSIEDNSYWKARVKNKKRSGGDYWLDSVIFPVLNNNEEVEGYKSIEIDISYLKKIQEDTNLLYFDEELINLH